MAKKKKEVLPSSSAPRGQRSLTSFFGAARSKKTGEAIPPRKVQPGIARALRKQAAGRAEEANGGGASSGDEDGKRAQDEENLEPAEKAAKKATGNKKDAEKNERAEKVSERENVENGDEGSADAAAEEKSSATAASEGDPMDTEDKDVAKKPAAKNPAAKKPAVKKPAIKKTATTKHAVKKPAVKKPAVRESEETAEEAADDLMDTDDETVAEKPAAKKPAIKKPTIEKPAAKKTAARESKKKAAATSRKRVIDNDSSEDEEEEEEEDEDEEEEEYDGQEAEEAEDSDTTVDLPSDEDEEEEEEEEASPKKSTVKSTKKKTTKNDDSSPPPKSKKQKTITGKAAPKAAKAKATKSKSGGKPGSKSEAVARAMKSNSQLAEIMSEEIREDGADMWEAGTPAPYAALCNVFGEIEGISGRLEIQERLAELFRKVLLRDGGGDDGDEGTEDGEEDGDDGKEDGKAGGKADGKAGGKANGKAGGKADNKDGKGADGKADKKDRSDLYALLYLSSNSVAPQHANVELGVGDSILIKAVGEASGTAPGMIKKKYEKEGDLGDVAMSARGKQRTLVGFGRVSGPKRLSCNDVLKVFKEIANTSGSQSQKWKVDKIKSLLVRARGYESKYIVRGLQGKLRIGLASTTVLASLAHAVALTRPRGVEVPGEGRLEEIRGLDGTEGAYPDFARKLCNERALPLDVRLDATSSIVKKAYMEVPSYDSLLDALLSVPLQEVHKSCTLTPGIPVAPMLAKPTKSVRDVLKRLDGVRFTCEYKYDGERAQVHMTPNGETKVFSRSLLDTSEKFPEVPLYVREACNPDASVSSFVLDTEVVAFNRETGQFVPFQVLSTRKRTGESAESAKVRVIVQAFDLMYLNGKSLLDKTLAERRELMKGHFLPVEGKFRYATSMDHTEDGDTAVIEEFLEAAVKGQCEGLMVKTLDDNATYQPNRRSLNWLKLKKDYLDGLGDSVDLVPLGAYHGKGKRAGVYGAYLLACYDQDTEQFQSVCKIGTGFSEEDLKDFAASFQDHVIPEKTSQYNVSDALECDVWFDAVRVWEVKAADLSKSSTHRGAVDRTGESGRGIGLRFPRFERERPDKRPEDATSSEQILDMYYAQDSIVAGGDGGMDMDGI